jgi:hypothetical protein
MSLTVGKIRVLKGKPLSVPSVEKILSKGNSHHDRQEAGAGGVATRIEQRPARAM